MKTGVPDDFQNYAMCWFVAFSKLVAFWGGCTGQSNRHPHPHNRCFFFSLGVVFVFF